MRSGYSEKNVLFILTILECIEKIHLYITPFGESVGFFTAMDQQPYNACCHLLLAVSEDSKKIEESLKEEFSFIAWDQISGLRNRIAHDYRGIDYEIVFQICRFELDSLRDACINMLKLLKVSKVNLVRLVGLPHYRHLGYLKDLGFF